MATLSILYFAWVREMIGRDEDIVAPPPGASVADVIALLATRGGGYAQAMAQPEKLRAALDQSFVPMDAPIGDARELALFPPVTGG